MSGTERPGERENRRRSNTVPGALNLFWGPVGCRYLFSVYFCGFRKLIEHVLVVLEGHLAVNELLHVRLKGRCVVSELLKEGVKLRWDVKHMLDLGRDLRRDVRRYAAQQGRYLHKKLPPMSQASLNNNV